MTRELLQQEPEAHLFELWWSEYLPEHNKSFAWNAFNAASRAAPPAQPAPVLPGYVPVPVEALQRWQSAFAEELSAWDIDPPLHHVQTSHDEISAMLSAAPPAQAVPLTPLTDEQITKGAFDSALHFMTLAWAFRAGVKFAERAHGITAPEANNG